MVAHVRRAMTAPISSDGAGAPNLLGWHVLAGDNFPHLLHLTVLHLRAFDLIYLDPPYNCGYLLSAYDDTSSDVRDQAWLSTVLGGDASTLDQRERWLNLLYARLLVLAELLSPAGAVAASIDSCEVHHLAVLFAEVFGGRGPVRSYAWPHAVQPHDPSEVPVRMNHLLISASAARHCTLPGTATVAGKPSETLRPMTEKSILRQAGIERTQR